MDGYFRKKAEDDYEYYGEKVHDAERLACKSHFTAVEIWYLLGIAGNDSSRVWAVIRGGYPSIKEAAEALYEEQEQGEGGKEAD